MKKLFLAALAATLGFSAAADAAVIYKFTTNEPFAGGDLSFTYEAEDYLSDTGFIERSFLTNATASIQRVRFEASCPFGGGTANCDQVTVVAETGFGSTLAYRYFSNGAFSSAGTYSGLTSTPASLGVQAVAAVPEASTWGLMIMGFGVSGAAMRRRPRRNVALA